MKVRVLLLEDIYKCGYIGDIVYVKRGYAVNYLVPKGLAVLVGKKDERLVKYYNSIVQTKKEQKRKEALTVSEKIQELVATFERKVSHTGTLFESVDIDDIYKFLKQNDINVDKKRIKLQESIKTTGEFEIPIELTKDVEPKLKVIVKTQQEQEIKEEAKDETASSDSQVENAE